MSVFFLYVKKKKEKKSHFLIFLNKQQSSNPVPHNVFWELETHCSVSATNMVNEVPAKMDEVNFHSAKLNGLNIMKL